MGLKNKYLNAMILTFNLYYSKAHLLWLEI